MLAVHVRWMIRRDMPEVLEIDAECFAAPWLEDDFVHVLRHRNCIGMVADSGDLVAGFMIYELYKTRLHLLRFAVHPQFAGVGVGDTMIRKLSGKLSPDRRKRVSIEICETDVAAQLFWKSHGFRAVSILREHQPNGRDTILFELRVCEVRPSNRAPRTHDER
jgi:ribosomal-protein-alanine N-acetyltransferase